MNIVINNKYESLRAFVEGLHEGVFEREGTTLFEGRNRVKAFDTADGRVVVKKYKRPGLINRVVYTFFKHTKAHRAYYNALELEMRGIETPAPVAFVEVKEGGLVRDTYFVSGYTDWPALSTVTAELRDENSPELDAFARFAANLHEKGVNHKDFNINNILFDKNAAGGYAFALIDINRMKFMRMGRGACVTNFVRFCSSAAADRQVMRAVMHKYALVRGWDLERCTARLARQLDAFEFRRKTRKALKRFIKGRL